MSRSEYTLSTRQWQEAIQTQQQHPFTQIHWSSTNESNKFIHRLNYNYIYYNGCIKKKFFLKCSIH